MEDVTRAELRTAERPTLTLPTVRPDQPTEVVQVQAARPGRPWLIPLICVALFAGAFLLNSVRTMEAIDITADESTYAIESVALGRTGMTLWNGTPFFVHPPLFFLTEAVYYGMMGVGDGPLFDRLIRQGEGYMAGEALLPPDAALTGASMLRAIEAGRYLNAFYGAVLTVLVFLFGRALLNWQLGALGAVLFALDPYVVWRNHFNYLEPLVTIFGLAALYAYYKAQGQPGRDSRLRYLLLTGLFFGLAMLTKELALLYFAAIVAHALLFRRSILPQTIIPLGVGMGIYALFPIWAALNGFFDEWWDAKTWLLQRGTGQIRDSGLGRPGVSIVDTLLINLGDYWPWLLSLPIAGLLAAAFLFLYYRRGLRDAPAELLSGAIIGTYGFFVVVRLLGGVINEQYFYSLMPFVSLSIAYTAIRLPYWRGMLGAQPARPRGAAPGATMAIDVTPELTARRASRLNKVLLGVFGVLIAYNALAWTGRYVIGSDNSYTRVEAELGNLLPPGTAIVGRDLLTMYLMPKQAVFTFSYLNLVGKYVDPANVLERRIPYAILNDQSLLQQYGGANPRYYEWVRQNGEEIDRYRGRKYTTAVYQIDYSRAVEEFGANSLAVGRPAFTSSSENADRYGAGNAFDAKITSRWASEAGVDEQWIYVDLGQSTTFGRLELYWEDAFARRYELQVSDDGVNWSTFYRTEQGAGGLEIVDSGATGRYVRLLLTQRGTEFGYSLWEISIYP